MKILISKGTEKTMENEKRRAFEGDRGCRALIDMQCENCAFFKTEEQAAEDRRRAAERIVSLAFEKRKRIVGKYYRQRSHESAEEVT